MSKTIISFDFGLSSIGIAVGQTITGTASPLNAIKARDGVPNWQIIASIYTEWMPDLCVVGLPLNMDGSEQPISDRARTFSNRLKGRFRTPVELWDERLTTVSAKAELFALGGFKKLEKSKIDSVSAVLILQSWFENQ